LTVIDWVVAPLLQRLPVALDEVRVTDPPAQKMVGPLAVTVGVGTLVTVTVVALEVALQPLLITVTL
jgi:hypothetical protein